MPGDHAHPATLATNKMPAKAALTCRRQPPARDRVNELPTPVARSSRNTFNFGALVVLSEFNLLHDIIATPFRRAFNLKPPLQRAHYYVEFFPCLHLDCLLLLLTIPSRRLLLLLLTPHPGKLVFDQTVTRDSVRATALEDDFESLE